MALICVCLFVATVKINAMQIVHDGSNETSPTIWSCYANLNHYYLFISLEIDFLYGL